VFGEIIEEEFGDFIKSVDTSQQSHQYASVNNSAIQQINAGTQSHKIPQSDTNLETWVDFLTIAVPKTKSSQETSVSGIKMREQILLELGADFS
jgi:hypothetical protein